MATSPAELVQKHLSESAAVKLQLADSDAVSVIVDAAGQLAGRVARGGKIMLCGNGGSAADCQHIAAEFTSRLRASMERPGIPALALTTDSSYLTARGNDYGFEDIFERLIDSLGLQGDALIAISTSGTSRNVVRAVTRAREKEILTVGLFGGTGGLLGGLVDFAIVVTEQPGAAHSGIALCCRRRSHSGRTGGRNPLRGVIGFLPAAVETY